MSPRPNLVVGRCYVCREPLRRTEMVSLPDRSGIRRKMHVHCRDRFEQSNPKIGGLR